MLRFRSFLALTGGEVERVTWTQIPLHPAFVVSPSPPGRPESLLWYSPGKAGSCGPSLSAPPGLKEEPRTALSAPGGLLCGHLSPQVNRSHHQLGPACTFLRDFQLPEQ